MEKAVQHFGAAIAIDSSYRLAHAGLADAYLLLVQYNRLPPKEGYPKARAAARKALEIDETLAEAHTSLAVVKQDYEWDWSGAEKEFRRAIELNPGYATTHQWYGEYLSRMARHEEAIAEVKRARELDPLSLAANRAVGHAYYYARQYDHAITEFSKTLEMDSNYVNARAGLSEAYFRKDMFDEAVAETSTAIRIAGLRQERAEALREAYRVGGIRGFLQASLELLSELSRHGYVPPYELAARYALLGKKDEAFTWLEEAYEERSWRLTLMKVEPALDSLRSDPRFVALLKRVGLEE